MKEEEPVARKPKVCGKCGKEIKQRIVRSINYILHCDPCYRKAILGGKES
jgi:ribosomal protein L37AE/L43A